MRNPLTAFTDPVRRPRALMWSAAIIVAFAGFYAGAQMFTSGTWFCEVPCHSVHADNTAAYNTSSHSQISCITCHYPVQQNPISFALDRVDKLIDIPPTIADSWEKPLNEFSHLAAVTPDAQCTQCHNIQNGPLRNSAGILMDKAAHEKHTKQGINCTTCHNRVAHLETVPTIVPGNKKHEDFMTMTACFRCHSLTTAAAGEIVAPGRCSLCHPVGFKLRPASHDATGWAGMGHGKEADRIATETATVREEWKKAEPKFLEKSPRILAQIAGVHDPLIVKPPLPPAGTIYECSTCHTKQFCEDCHKAVKPPVNPSVISFW